MRSGFICLFSYSNPPAARKLLYQFVRVAGHPQSSAPLFLFNSGSIRINNSNKKTTTLPPLASMPYATRPSSSRPQRSGQSKIVCVHHGGDVNAGQDSLCIYNAVQKGSRRQEKKWPCVCVCCGDRKIIAEVSRRVTTLS